MTNFAETITVDNIDIPINDVNKIEKVVKVKKERSEKQKENDIKLKERLSEYHKKKKQAKEELALKQIQDTLQQLEEKVIVQNTDNNNIHQSEVTIQIDEFKKMNIEDIFEPKPKKVRGRPKSKEIIN
jgi:cell fate regulator YaaT (PSP1 superfamily)